MADVPRGILHFMSRHQPDRLDQISYSIRAGQHHLPVADVFFCQCSSMCALPEQKDKECATVFPWRSDTSLDYLMLTQGATSIN